MVPLCNLSLSGIGFNYHGKADFLNSSVTFSLDVRSFNDKYDAWEPLIEPVDGTLRYNFVKQNLFIHFKVCYVNC